MRGFTDGRYRQGQLAGVDVLEASFLGRFSEGGGFNTNIGGIHFTDRPAQLARALKSETDPPCL